MKALLQFAFTCGLIGSLHAADGDRFFPLPLELLGGKRFASYPADQPWSSIPADRQTLGGVPFQAVAKFQLQGTGDARDGRLYPTRGTGLPVGQRVARLHVLHGANMSDRDGRPVASLHVNYAGGRTHQLFLTYGVHTLDWWKHRGEAVNRISDTNSAEVWTGTSESAAKQGSTHRLFKTTFDLPASDQPVESIDLYSLFGRASLVFVAMTAEAPGAEAGAARAAPSEDDARYRDELVAVVTGPANEALAGARLRGSAYDRDNAVTLLGKSDDAGEEQGIVPVDYPAGAQRLRLNLSASGCATKELAVTAGADGKLPRQLAAKLERGARISGLVRDRAGAPVAKAKVEIRGRTTGRADRPAGSVYFNYDEATTDAQGRWRSTAVPGSLENVSFRVTRAGLRPAQIEIASASVKGSVNAAELLEGRAEFHLASMSNVGGLVQDASGQPLPQADVTLTRGTSSLRRQQTQTDAEGRFAFPDAPATNATLVVQHAAFAPVIRPLREEEEVNALAITMTTGAPLRGRVVRGAGSGALRGTAPAAAPSTNSLPLAGAVVTVSSAESSLVRWTNITDAAGRFVWEHAPAGPLRVTARHSGIGSPLLTTEAGGGEAIISLATGFGGTTPAILSGRVIDADTGQPIPAFTVTPGENWSADRITWRPANSLPGTAGHFTLLSQRYGGGGARFLAKIEAPGYWPGLTRATNGEGQTNLIALRPGADRRGTVKLPSGQPAAGARLVVVGEGTVGLGHGTLLNRSGPRNSLVVTADASGRFEMPLRLSQRVVAVHPEGYAETTLSHLGTNSEITLQPYGTIEGIVLIGRQPATNAEVKLNESRSAEGLQYEYDDFSARTDPEGRFRFTHVPPGSRSLVRLIPTHRSTKAWSHQTQVTVEPGQTVRSTVGGTGRAVIGRVRPSDPLRPVDWSNGSHSLGTRLVQPPFRTSADYEAWAQSPDGRAAEDAYRYYAVVFAADGSFRAEDVPSGLYQLNFNFYEPRATDGNTGGVSYGPSVGNVSYSFEIGPLPGGRSDEALDVGTLELEVRSTARPQQ